jgi:hypothetical protein
LMRWTRAGAWRGERRPPGPQRRQHGRSRCGRRHLGRNPRKNKAPAKWRSKAAGKGSIPPPPEHSSKPRTRTVTTTTLHMTLCPGPPGPQQQHAVVTTPARLGHHWGGGQHRATHRHIRALTLGHLFVRHRMLGPVSVVIGAGNPNGQTRLGGVVLVGHGVAQLRLPRKIQGGRVVASGDWEPAVCLP